MKEKQKILNILSIVIIIWQIISGVIKVGICSILLLCCIITCSSTEITTSIAEHINFILTSYIMLTLAIQQLMK